MNNIASGLITKAKVFGKYIDQPALIENVYNKMPPVLIAGATAFGLYDTFNNKKVKQGEESRLKRFIKDAAILTGTVASTLVFGKKFIHLPHVHGHDIDDAIKTAGGDKGLVFLLKKIKEGKILKHKHIKKLYEKVKKLGDKGKGLIDEIIPTGHQHHGHGHNFFSRFPEFKEVADLTILGTIPIFGGIAGGVAGDFLTGENVKKEFPNKVKEGTYQYLANIVLCNVGAGAALIMINKSKYKNSKPVKFFGMLAGIAAVGVIGGSFIANYIGKSFINPLFDKQNHHNRENKQKNFYKDVYSERTPEWLDIGLHIDDVASAGVLSGFNIVTPALPILYSISAYRAGIGYRNNKKEDLTLEKESFKNPNDAYHHFRKRMHHYHNN